MRIGIDVDDTITNTYELVLNEIEKKYNISKEEIIKSGYSYDFMFSHENIFPGYLEFSNNTLRNIVHKATLKSGVKEVIEELHKMGHTIEIVSARNPDEYRSPYDVTLNYLLKNNIYFDKINVNVREKGSFCLNNNFDILIDDNVRHLNSAKTLGIDTIIIDNSFNRETNSFKRAYNWYDVLELISKVSVN